MTKLFTNLVQKVVISLKWTKWTKWTEQIFDESLKCLMQIFVESAESAKSARSIFATFATFASANFVGKASCESTVRYREWSRISLIKPLLNPYLTLTRFRLNLGSNLSRFSLASLICLCMLTVGVGNVWGDNTVTWTINGVSNTVSGGGNVNVTLTTSAKSPSSETGVWTAKANTSYAGNNSGAQFGSKSYTFNGTITLSGSAIPSTATIKSITLNCSSAAGSGSPYSVSVKVGATSFGSAKSVYGSATDYTWTGSVIGNTATFTITSGPTKNIVIKSISITYAPAVVTPHTVTFYKTDGSTQAITEASAGAGVTPPTMQATCDDWTFQGWSKSQSTSSTSTTVLTTETLTAGKYYPSANTTLYPVYTKSGGTVFSQYQLITSAPGDLSGKYLLSTGTITASGTLSNNALVYETLTPGTTEKSTKEFSIVKNGNNSNYFIKFPNGHYLGNANSSADLKSNNSTSAPTTDVNHFLWTLSTTAITNVNNSTRLLMYNNTAKTPAIKSYANSNSYPHIKLYKRIETTLTYYYSYPTCCTPLGTINGSVSWSNPTEVVVSWDNLDHVSSWTVACKVHGGSAAGTIGSITTNGEGKKTCTITGLTCNTDYDFTITANPAIGYCEKEETLENKNSGKWNVAYSLTGVTKSSGPATGANVCGDYTAVFTPSNAAYALPSDVTVQIGGVTKTKDTDYTWDSSTGTLSIASNKITGDLSITVTGILVGCSADPTIGAASLSGAFGLSSVGVTVGTSSTGSAYCAWTDYGFVWGTSADPTVSDNKVQIGNSDAATTWSGNLTGSFSVGTTYYFRAYGKNGKEDATYVYSSDASFTPRSVTCESVTGGTISAGTEVSVSGKTITLTATPDSHFSFGSWTVTNNSTSATITVTNNQFTMPDANVTVTATFNEDAYKTVTFYNNSTNTGITGYTNMKVYVGDTPSEPTLTDGTSGDACDATSDKHYGWSRDTWSGTIDTEAHMTGSPGNHTVYQKGSVPAVVAGDPATISYHAVWAAGSQYWGRLTSSELSGLSAGTELVIVAVDQGYVLQNDLTCSNSVPAETDGKISPTDNIKWTLAGSAGAWQLKSGTDILGTQYNSCAGSGNGVVLAFNLNHQTYSIASSSHATNEFYIKDNACDYGVLTKVSKYDDIRIVNVSSYSSVASAALKLYIKKGSYSEFITNCCSASTLAFAASPYAVIRQNIGGASTTTWAEVDVTFTSNNTTGAISATTYTDGKTVYKLSSWEGRGTTGGTLCANDHAYFEVLTQPSGETPGTGKFHVKTTSGQTGQGTYRIALTQESTDESHGNFCETTAYGFVDVTLRDKFVDNVNGNGTVNRDGHGAQLATPTLSEFGTQVEDACHEEGRKLKGWIKETDLKAQYETGNSTRVQTIDGLCESCSSASDQTLLIVTPGTNVTMSGATWYAVWAYEK